MAKEYFISEEPVKIEIDGDVYLIREFTGEEADKISNDYIKLDVKGNLVLDIAKRNKAWLKVAVIDAPFGGVDGKEFKDNTPDQKAEILNKLKPKIRIPLIQAISDLNSVEADVAKNYKRQS